MPRASAPCLGLVRAGDRSWLRCAWPASARRSATRRRRRARPRRQRRRVRGAAGPERRRQDHHPAPGRRPRAARRAAGSPIGGADVTARAAGGARRRLGVPAVLALPASPCSTIWPSRCARRCGARAEDRIGRRVRRVAELLHIEGKLDNRRPALRRRDAARRHRPCAGPPAARLPDGRAALLARRQAARGSAHRAQAHPARARRHHPLRHPRPDRGHDHGRPHRRHRGGPAAAAGLAARGLRAGPPTRPWPVAWARRRSTCCPWACVPHALRCCRHSRRPARGRRPGRPNGIEARIEQVEPLGPETVVLLQLPGPAACADARPRPGRGRGRDARGRATARPCCSSPPTAGGSPPEETPRCRANGSWP